MQKGVRVTNNTENEETDNPEPEVTTVKTGKKVKAVIRASPFCASILYSIRKTGWQGRDEGFVHLKEGTPLPYTTSFTIRIYKVYSA